MDYFIYMTHEKLTKNRDYFICVTFGPSQITRVAFLSTTSHVHFQPGCEYNQALKSCHFSSTK